MLKFECPHCGQHLDAQEQLAGQAIWCRDCNKRVTIPRTSISDEPEVERIVTESAGSTLAGNSSASWRGSLNAHRAVRFVRDRRLRLAILSGVAGLFVVAWIDKSTAQNAAAFFAFLGIVIWSFSYYWAICRAADGDRAAWLEFIVPKFGKVVVHHSKEEMEGPSRMFLIGLSFLALALALACLHSALIWGR